MLDNVTHVSANPFPESSKLYFPVVERQNAWIDKHGNAHAIDKQKSLVRHTDNGPMWLANVGENYKVVHNSELFPYMEDVMRQCIDPKYLTDVTVNDQMAHYGRDCYREYIFNNLKCDLDRGDVAFRMILGNSYGSKAVTLLYGAIDFWCSNGMIIGQSEKQTRKHTSGVSITGFEQWVYDAFSQFVSYGQKLRHYDDTMIDLTNEDGLFVYLQQKNLLSGQMARRMQADMHTERNKRSGRDVRPSLWDLYCALTSWASHDAVRDTGNDHEVNTRIQRTRHAERVITAANDWMEVNV